MLGSWMTTYLGKSCSFGFPRVPFVNCRQFLYLVITLWVLRAGCGIWLYQFLIIAYLFTFHPLADFFHIELIILQFKYCLFILYLVWFTLHFDLFPSCREFVTFLVFRSCSFSVLNYSVWFNSCSCYPVFRMAHNNKHCPGINGKCSKIVPYWDNHSVCRACRNDACSPTSTCELCADWSEKLWKAFSKCLHRASQAETFKPRSQTSSQVPENGPGRSCPSHVLAKDLGKDSSPHLCSEVAHQFRLQLSRPQKLAILTSYSRVCPLQLVKTRCRAVMASQTGILPVATLVLTVTSQWIRT